MTVCATRQLIPMYFAACDINTNFAYFFFTNNFWTKRRNPPKLNSRKARNKTFKINDKYLYWIYYSTIRSVSVPFLFHCVVGRRIDAHPQQQLEYICAVVVVATERTQWHVPTEYSTIQRYTFVACFFYGRRIKVEHKKVVKWCAHAECWTYKYIK